MRKFASVTSSLNGANLHIRLDQIVGIEEIGPNTANIVVAGAPHKYRIDISQSDLSDLIDTAALGSDSRLVDPYTEMRRLQKQIFDTQMKLGEEKIVVPTKKRKKTKRKVKK